MPKVQLNGIDLFYDIKGTGEPLLLISGFTCDHSYWLTLAQFFTSQYQVILLDNRGMGRSSAPNSPYSIKELADDAAGLLEHLGIDKVHVAGHSMGGQIAQELALAYPQKIKSLILLSSLAKGDERFNSIIETWGELPKHIDRRLYQKILLSWSFSEAFYSSSDIIEQLIEWAVHYPFAPQNDSIYYQSQAIINCDITNHLQKIICPTLVLVSKQDILTPIKFSEELAQGIPHAKLEILDCGGHGFMIESPNIVSTAILDFLAQIN
ncbi:alpha/beta fold hydrolase [Anabaena subtropica]|uniref:Alpha/beta hydrolase n=1 Tax=Anabaena subtropica FACHB-260 TaxID=2692884 RepID=A0ABR8CW54_9NOST|nr:alpha/beta hydrolase [Anabaena subtropica]MBD2347239.1 alpha/beta hydrolase [Anabaena subtropica FACHB-260]